MSAPANLVVYSAPDCCLCEEAGAVLERLRGELEFEVRWIDIAGDEQLEAQWRTSIPAGVLDGRLVFKYHVDEALLRRRLPARVR